ncbi:MAG: hypothetical protein KGL39_47050 [Patescibacteria group bacterium]|nr:hypothetical protein [Patescibacteria group bacterium]
MINLPQNPTKNELIERYWFGFLKYQQAELRKRKASGFGVPKADYSEQAFWEYLVEQRPEVLDASPAA